MCGREVALLWDIDNLPPPIHGAKAMAKSLQVTLLMCGTLSTQCKPCSARVGDGLNNQTKENAPMVV